MGNRYTCKMTFEEWCIGNNRQDLLDRWDYNKNDKLPSQVAYRSRQKIFFHSPDEFRRLDRVTTSDDIGIYKNTKSRREDLTGQSFGELIVLRLDTEKHMVLITTIHIGYVDVVVGLLYIQLRIN